MEPEIVHQDLHTVYSFPVRRADGVFALITEITTDDLLLCRFADNRIVRNGESDAVHSHIGRRLIRLVFAHDPFADAAYHRKNFNVAVVIDRGHSIVFQMERINHIDIADIRSRGFVSDIDRMIQGKAPYGECFEFRVACGNAAPVFMINL